MSARMTGGRATGPHSKAALREIEDNDLDRYMRLEGSKGVVDAARVLYDENCFILRKEDGLVKHLITAARGAAPRHTVRMSMSCAEAGDSDADTSPGGRFEIIFMQKQKEKENRPGAAGHAKLASKTRERLAQALPRPRLRMLNLGLGVAVFALMSATSLVALSPPLSHVFATGALASAGIMLARAARRRA